MEQRRVAPKKRPRLDDDDGHEPAFSQEWEDAEEGEVLDDLPSWYREATASWILPSIDTQYELTTLQDVRRQSLPIVPSIEYPKKPLQPSSLSSLPFESHRWSSPYDIDDDHDNNDIHNSSPPKRRIESSGFDEEDDDTHISKSSLSTLSFLDDLSSRLSSLKVADSLSLSEEEVYTKLVERIVITPEIKKQASEIFDSLVSELLKENVQSSKSVSGLNEESRDEADRLMWNTDELEVIKKKFNVDVLGKDLHTLRDGEWLNDEVINFHIKMMQERMQRNLDDKTNCVPEANKLRCLFFNTFFYTKLSDNGKGYKYKAVRRWSKKQKVQVHPSVLDKVIIPVNVGNNHWTLSVIDLKRKRFEYYDSLGHSNPRCLSYLRNYLKDEIKHYRNEDANLDDWQDHVPSNIPQQRNGCDCGVFTTKYADYVSEDRKLDFTQENMPYFRRRMALEIQNGEIL
mmetsp:Transcript_31328/g.55059  ORF Transcript_31328/g.55059 Transcript_31328/m.55059 type:complete len:457 (-) Transcript_31328:131-1501(-)